MNPRLSFGVVVVLGGLAGCAHTTPPRVEAAPPLAPPAPEAQVTAPAAPPVSDPAAEIDAALRTATVRFDFDSAQLKPEGMEALRKIAAVLRKHPGAAVVQIDGNCDERGTEEYNLALGQRRAEVARQYMVDLGVSPAQLNAISYGALRPVNPAHTEEAWIENRRDELHASR